mmetsp:Transcript_26166/g.40793  ORF Transcript_26166/g.40793 Transcript_26166/m.40793 type:complete len:115 (-) Transcript_26166:98-442(-)|eukprot:CAMPEP_0201519882 /NCGR_PEP_ID=MMETSP0161_2-20130828/10325_1 /ASSEMBLY_ACC=CAM_ASM_000251 /TAXON_ID=180227 /ORGANISM="Neoparamoeba aestuarina, Strain SoJaBio B1-5/56/2" /LENGTH=114 /DNA_ID=CAMNT_0047918057 /DNA_START=87 /DNA_END=431 /DNA_ORIENTATION=+
MSQEDLKKEVEALVSELGVLTAEEPKDLAAKVGKHVPQVEIADGKVTATVPHGMAAEHWIQYIWAKVGDEIVAVKKLEHTDEPKFTFDKPAGAELVVYQRCTLDRVWKTSPIAL